jgi:hypothetical protein
MPYDVADILNWASISQPLARIGEAKRLANGDRAADVDLDMKIYNTRLDVLYCYNDDPNADELYIMGNYLLMLIGRYLFPAQAAIGETGSIASITTGGGGTVIYVGLELP